MTRGPALLTAPLLALAIVVAPAAAERQSLLSGRRAKLSSGDAFDGFAVFSSEDALARFPDPRCPASSRLHLARSGDERSVIPLDCSLWRRTPRGYRYADRSAGRVRLRLSPERGRLIVKVRSAAARRRQPALAFEVELEVNDHSFCGRFQSVRSASAARVTFDAPSRACELVRPNFIVVVLDDARFDGLDRMPVLQQRVVAEGVSFDNAFTPFSSCCPSRASILTGMYALRHGTRQVSGALGGADTFRESGADRETIAVWLQRAGYRTGLFGKYLNDYSASESDKGPGGSFYVPPGWDRWWAFVSPEHYGGVLGQSYVIVEEAGSLTAHSDHSSDAQYSTDLSAATLRAFVAEAAAARRPFFALWAPYAPHGETPGFTAAPAQRHENLFLTMPRWRPVSWSEADVTDKPRWVQRLQARQRDPAFWPLIAAATDQGRSRQYESLLSVDEQLGAILDQLAALGVDGETFVLVTSDNGLGWGEHHMWMTKGCPYEECQRVPMVVRYPRRTILRNVAAGVLNLDIAPTVAALAGAAVPYAADGASFAEWLWPDSRPPEWRSDYLLELWRLSHADRLSYSGQVVDGDSIRVLHGHPRQHPRPSRTFEFDSGDGVTPGAVAVAIGADADTSFATLAQAITANILGVRASLSSEDRRLVAIATASVEHSVYFWEEADQAGIMQPDTLLPNFFGVRDLANGLAWFEYETGERELYDLGDDPSQLDNRAADSAYAVERVRLEQRLQELLAEIETR